MLRLVASDRPPLEIDRDAVVLGRDASADMLVDERSVSRRHARLTRAGGLWTVEDLGSGNGTWIDGQRVATAPLANGQELRLGTLAFRVEIDGAAPAATMLVPALASVPPSRASLPTPAHAAPPPLPSGAAGDPYGSQAYAPPPQQAYATDPYARSSTGGNGIWKILGVLLVAYLAYDHFGKKEEATAPSEQTRPGGGGQPQKPASGSLRIASIDVQKSRAKDGGTAVLIRTLVEGFGARKVAGGYQTSVVQDVETTLPDGQRIDQLSKKELNVLEEVVNTDEGLNATLDFSFTLPAGAQGVLLTRTRVHDRVGGGEVSGEAKVEVP